MPAITTKNHLPDISSSSALEAALEKLPPHSLGIINTMKDIELRIVGEDRARRSEIDSLQEERRDLLVMAERHARDFKKFGTESIQIEEERCRRQAQDRAERIKKLQNAKTENPLRIGVIETELAKHGGNFEYVAKIPNVDEFSDDLAGSLDGIRQEIARLRAEARNVEISHIPLADAKAIANAQIEKMARAGEPNVDLLFRRVKIGANRRGPGSVRFNLLSPELGEAHVKADVQKLLEIMIFLAEDTAKAKLARLIEARSFPDRQMPVEGRAEKIAALNSEAAELEFLEGALIFELERQGKTIARRFDMNPLAALLVDAIPITRAPATQSQNWVDLN